MGLKETRKKAMALMIAACMAGTSTTPVMAADLDTMFTDGAQDSLEQNNLSSSGENSYVSRTVNYKFKMPDGSFVSGGSFVTDKFSIQGSELAKIIEDTIPQGYQLIADKFYTLGFGSGSVDLYFDLIEMETKDIAIYYYCPDDNFSTDGKSVTVEGTATTIDIKDLTDIPEGYEIDEVASNVKDGKIAINPGDQIQVTLKKSDRDIAIYYYCPDDNFSADGKSITVEGTATTIDIKDLTDIPEGYEIDEAETFVKDGKIAINPGDQIQVTLKKIDTTKVIGINFWDIENNKQAGESEIIVDANADNVNTSTFADKVPEGYELVSVGNIEINDSWIYVEVRPVAIKPYFHFRFVVKDDNGNEKVVGSSALQFPADTKIIKYSVLAERGMVPDGYELCYSGDLWIEGATDMNKPIIIEVRKAQKEVSVIYRTRDKKVVGRDTIAVDSDAASVNTKLLEAPKGYTIAIVGDLEITKDNKVYVTVDAAQKKIGIVYRTQNGKVIARKAMTVAKDAKYINASELKAPDGYKVISNGKLKITNNKVYVYVKAINKTITIYYKTSATKTVKTEQLQVSSSAKTIPVSALNIPANYRLLTNASSLAIKKGDYVNVPVAVDTRKDVQKLKISVGKTFYYTGSPITPRVTVKDSWKTLKQGKDYTVAYRNNIKRGKASILIKGIGNYKGQKTISFQIR